MEENPIIHEVLSHLGCTAERISLSPRAIPTFNNSNVLKSSSQSAGQFAGSLVTAFVLFAVQVFAFLLIKDRFARIYQPRTYLVPPRERTEPVAPGWFKWAKQVLSTSNSEFVQRCGLDAYFFLRYLRMLLKIFVPAAIVILPVLLPINAVGGRGSSYALSNYGTTNITGLNQLSWSNVRPDKTNRYWAHWLMALFFIVYICYVIFDELKNYIRMRQAYITSPQHRLRASATTVLVSSIPSKWCSVEALDGLYDVFPGGLRNIWINRNFDELNEKVKKRDQIALQLESAETDLIKKCYKKNEENINNAAKAAGRKMTRAQRKQDAAIKDEKGQQQAEGRGVTTGDPHQVKHTLHEQLGEADGTESSSSLEKADKATSKPRKKPILGEGLQAINLGLNKFNKGLRNVVNVPGKGVTELAADTYGFSNQYRSEAAANRPQNLPPQNDPSSAQVVRDNRDDSRLADSVSPTSTNTGKPGKESTRPALSSWQRMLAVLGFSTSPREQTHYPPAFNKEFEEDTQDAVWRNYIEDKDRDTYRLPLADWMFSLPLVGQKVDTIYWCRRELARLNLEIEDDQAHPERFPLMNSAFIQFNHQVAAHMACQSVSHHLPKQMAPRLIEIDPSDVIWDNMSIPWWQTYIRTTFVIATVIGMTILWAIPIAFTASLAQLTTLAEQYSWLRWVLRIPSWIRLTLQGVLPIALLGLLMFLLPLILRFLSRLQGTKSGLLVELSVQKYYFFFIFIQIFLIVTIGSSVAQLVADLQSVQGLTNIPQLLGETIPVASNYFFNYMLLQAFSVSSGALLQIWSLIVWFILAPIFDSTARAKFNRQTTLQNVQWGTFFPVYTNLACIGIIYSVVSPLILIFNIITFTLFWFVYRYNSLFVTRFTLDTGGLLYPNAINCTFVGVYVLELGLIGLFFLVRDQNNNVACKGQGIGMIVILVLTIIYQILLNNAFSPLYRYLPITLEDDAVRRDEEFARALRRRHAQRAHHEHLIEYEREDENIEHQLEENERKERQEIEMIRISGDQRFESSNERAIESDEEELSEYTYQNPEITLDVDDSKVLHKTKRLAEKAVNVVPGHLNVPLARGFSKRRKSWADRDNMHNRRSRHFGENYNPRSGHSDQSHINEHLEHADEDQHAQVNAGKSKRGGALTVLNNFNPIAGDEKDLEAQRRARAELADALYAGVNDELEDLTAEQRDALVQRAFQHSALRARRPVIWIPRDELGVSDNEVQNVGRFAQGNIWISNVRQGLDSKGRCVYSGAPPDFSEVDLIQL